MNSPRIAAAVALAGAGIIAATSAAGAQPRCQTVDATIRDKVVTEGCPPGTAACVVGTVDGRHHFDGTTVFVLGSRGEAPPTAPDQRPVSGTITYTFADGSTLTALETSIGNVNPTTGSGHAGGTQTFTGGTGSFAGASGNAYLATAEAIPGGRSVGVPGNIRLMALAHAKHGRLAWAKLFAPAIRIARDGFAMSPRLHQFLDRARKTGAMTAEGRALSVRECRELFAWAGAPPESDLEQLALPARPE